eukprot:GHRR01024165.1.p1 GENE.GHRR01024165.1~~GHRR01024165.1.p1  ORF type:complete len:521 (+),score=220.87 GHRR01024165.1:2182-3744(+)
MAAPIRAMSSHGRHDVTPAADMNSNTAVASKYLLPLVPAQWVQSITALYISYCSMQAAAHLSVHHGVCNFEAELQRKLGTTKGMVQSLEQILLAVNQELAGLARARQRVKSMVVHLQEKFGVNKARQQVCYDRPAHEQTCDEVTLSLSQQDVLFANVLERLQHAQGLLAASTDRLTNCKQQLVRDKISALKVNKAVLGVKSGTSAASLASSPSSATDHSFASVTGGRKASSGSRYTHTWEKNTQTLVQEAQLLTADAGRLRHAVKQLLQAAHAANQAATQQLDDALAAKLGSIYALKGKLGAELSNVQEERNKAASQRDSLKKIVQDKQKPLQQHMAHRNLCQGQPESEAVEDGVQHALAAEAAQMAAVSTQLARRIDAAEQQIARLDDLSAALLSIIADKQAAITLEEKLALLDGRTVPAVPPTPSVLSVCSSMVSGYSRLGESASQVCSRVSTPAGRRGTGGSIAGASMTSNALIRIAALEHELAASKEQTEQLQKTLQELKVQAPRPHTSTAKPIKE